MEEQKVVEKYQQVVPKIFSQIALSIETLLDLSTLTLEEVTWRLKVVEDRLDPEELPAIGGKLLLTEGQWLACMKEQKQGEGSLGSGNARRHAHASRKNGGGGSSDGKEAARDLSHDKCRNCGRYGHWAKHCRSPKKE